MFFSAAALGFLVSSVAGKVIDVAVGDSTGATAFSPEAVVCS